MLTEYEEKRYRKLDQRVVDKREKWVLRKILASLRDEIELLLDVPCGFGRFFTIFNEMGIKFVGCDISTPFLSSAKEKSGGNPVVLGNLLSLPFDKDSFDFVLSIRIFQHLEDREVVIAVKEIARVTRRWALLSFYEREFLHILERKLTKRRSKIKMRSPKKINRIFQSSGLTLTKRVPIFSGFHAQHFFLLEKSSPLK